MKEKKARVEDAMHATKAAVEEGIVAGGGIAFIRAIPALDRLKDKNEDIQAGINIVRRAMEEPLRQIASNAGLEGSVVVNEARKRTGNEGFNAGTEKWVDMVKAGIIDPTKVTLTALQNASSIAGLMLTTEAIINELPEDDKAKAGGGMPGGGDMGGMGGMGGMY
jgi:chaperonin GroEL